MTRLIVNPFLRVVALAHFKTCGAMRADVIHQRLQFFLTD